MRIDLHVHSTASDGSTPPAEVVAHAVEARLDVIALTDHDTTAGLAAALAAAVDQPLEVVSGIEMSSTHDGRELHILGYFVDPGSPDLAGHENRALRLREDRIRAMVERLNAQGVPVDPERVLEIAGGDRSSIGRPHLASALVEAGHAATRHDAFDRLIGDDQPAFIPTNLATPWEALQIILDAGGLPVWAHPPYDLVEPLLPRLVQNGLKGLEVYRPKNSPDVVMRLERLARAHGLLMSGGSDWHGPEGGRELGDFFVTADDIGDFIEAGGM